MSTSASRPALRPLAILLGLLLAFAGLAVPATSASAAVGDDASSALSWGFKQSWRDYINGVTVPPPGSITASSGAAASGDAYVYTWSAESASFDSATGAGEIGFDGDLQFSKPAHGIDITVSNPRVVLSGDGTGDLYWTVGGSEVLGADIATITVGAATVSGTTSTVAVTGTDVTFTTAGAAAFGSYAAGEEMDDLAFTISSEVASSATPTSTSLTASSSTLIAGGGVVLVATVPVDVPGSVEFFDGATSLGSVAAVYRPATTGMGATPASNTATTALTTVAEGTHSYTARFSPTDAANFAASTSTPVSVVASAAAATLTGNVSGAELTWGFNHYSQVGGLAVPAGAATASGWAVTVAGGAEKVGAVGEASAGFKLTGGTGSADATTGIGAISYPGSVTYTPYGPAQPSFTLSDFRLTLSSATAGQLTGTVSFAIPATGPVTGPIPVTFATFGVDSLEGEDGSFALTTAAPDYEGTVAAGTYSGSYTSAWPQSFVAAIPIAFKSFFYQTSTSQGNLNKPPLPISAAYTATTPTTNVLTASSSTVVAGGAVQLTASLPLDVPGSVEFFEGSTSLGSSSAVFTPATTGMGATPATNLATKVVSPAEGSHSYTAVFTPTDSAQHGVSTSAPVSVVASASASILTGNVSGAELTWGFSHYAQVGGVTVPAGAATASGWAVTVADGAEKVGAVGNASAGFTLTGGTGAVDPVTGVGAISYPGSVTYTPYGPTQPSFTLSGFRLTLSSATEGVLTGTVSSASPATAPTLGPIPVTFATFDVSSLTSDAGDFALTTAAPDYEGTVAAGTYSGSYTSAWPQSFVAAIPIAFKSFFYQTSTSQGNLNKPPLPISAAFEANAVTTAVGISVSQSTGLQSGDTVTVAATVSPSTAVGVVRVLLDGVEIDSGPASATLTVTTPALAAGSHSVQAQFVPTNPAAYASSSSPALALTVAAPPAPAAGSLTWGIQTSFNAYVTGPIASGSISASNGAAVSGGAYTFVQAAGSTFDASTGLGTVPYRGAIRFYGHGGALDQTLSNPVVRIDSSSSAVVLASWGGTQLTFANLNLGGGTRTVDADGAVRYANVPATLNAGGVAFFGGNYPAGSALAPASFVIGSASTVVPSSTSRGTTATAAANTPDATPPTTEGVESEDTEFTEGSTVTFTAEGFQPNETGILAVIYSEPTVLADDVTADAAGSVTWTGTLPLGLTGEHTFTFQGSVDRGIVIDIAEAAVVGCVVESAELAWGFKESFRAYIDGSIANGEWTTADGATYETPLFGFEGTGGYDAETGDADLAFDGSVRFTGHDGALDTTIANPRVVIDGERAVLVLDISGTTQSGETVAQTGVEFAELDLAAAEQGGGGQLVAFSGIPATLTAAGAAAFGTYPEGEALDPVDVSITVDPACVEPAAVVEDEPSAEGENASVASPLPWIIGALVVLLLLAVLIAFLVRRARRTA